MKTIKQMADGLGIDKQRVYRFIKANRIAEAHQDRITKYYDEVVEIRIKEHFYGDTASDEARQTASHDAVIEILRSELEAKNRQIEALNLQLRDVTAALVAAQQTVAAAQVLHAGTMQHIATEDESSERKQGFFARIFRRNG